ncbi:hypothetical protein [Caenispirillum bisanense]|uniref:hypothetical protein n=1 Tax=Caenispirillum bisanense TaxID=414052 RepID=UPI0031DC45A6
MVVATFACTLLFAVVHLGVHHLHLVDHAPRSRWLSAAGGGAVAYLFMHILPELALHQQSLAPETEDGAWLVREQTIHAVALAGLAAFYGMERAVKRRRQRQRHDPLPPDAPRPGLYAVHLAAFAAYNAFVGYLLSHREAESLTALLLFAVAMALHFVSTDFALLRDHRERYRRHGRWLLTASAAAGWALGVATRLPDAAVGLLFAFLAGGMMLNILKEELPEERGSHFGAFAGGAALYAGLLLVAV